MSQYSIKQMKQGVVMFDLPQIDENTCCGTREEIEKGRMLTMKLTEALNTLPPQYKQALAGGDFYSEDGIAALRSLRKATSKKDFN